MDNLDVLSVDFEANDNFLEGYPIGNSHLGLMVYGNVLEEHLPINENTYWLGKNKKIRHSVNFYRNYKRVQELLLQDRIIDANELGKTLLPNPTSGAIYTSGGRLNIKYHTNKQAKNYKRYLNLQEGYVGVEYDLDNNHVKRTYIANYQNDCIAINIESDFELSLDVSLSIDNNFKYLKQISPNRQLMCAKVDGVRYYSLIDVKANQIKYINNKFLATGNNITIYFFGATTNFKTHPRLYLMNLINQQIESLKFKYIFDNSVKDYKSLYKRQSFHTNLDILDKYYNYSRYLMISSSRMNLPANLQGIWCDEYKPKWDSKYTLNINLEMNYYNTLESNLRECYEPLIELIKKINKEGKRVARVLYHARGSVTHHNTDIYGNCSMYDKYMPASIWPLGQICMCIYIFKYYYFTNDISFIKKNYKLLISNANFLLSILVKDKDNKYVIAPSLSPENSFDINGIKCTIACGTTADDEIIYEFFYNLIIVNRILGHEENDNKEYLDVILNLHHISISPKNVILEYHDDYKMLEPGHRHISHLYQTINPSIYLTNVVKEASYNTILDRLANDSDTTGWSASFITLLLVHLGYKEDAYNEFIKYTKMHSTKTLLNTGNVFQIDGNFGIARAIHDMFILDSNSKLYICKALPNDCNTFTLNGFPIYNNMIVDLFKTKDDFVLQVEAKQNKDLVINYNNKDYFLKVKEGKNRFDLNEVFKN